MPAVRERRYGTMSVEVPSSVTVRIAGRPSSVKVIIMDAPPTVYRYGRVSGLAMNGYCGD